LYDFKVLSPADFEDLTRDLLQQWWKVKLESFKTGGDQGVDLRYAAVPGQPVIVQCKHYAGSSVAKLIRDIRTNELPKTPIAFFHHMRKQYEEFCKQSAQNS